MAFDFENAVIRRSHEVPVVVDFWAPWCGPCRVLGPILDTVAAEAGDRWELVKIDTEQAPDVAQRCEVRGIPAVRLFHRGEQIAEFVGALPEPEVRRWLDTNLPDGRGGELETILADWTTRKREEWLPGLETFVRDHPDFAEARLQLSLAIVGDEPGRARALLDDLRKPAEHEEAVGDLESLADLAECDGGIPDNAEPHVAAAREALATLDLDATLHHLVRAVGADRGFRDELARRAAVALFRRMGFDHEISRRHRPALSMALHS